MRTLENKEQKGIEKLFELRTNTNSFLSGEELAKEAKKSFHSRKETIRQVLDGKSQ